MLVILMFLVALTICNVFFWYIVYQLHFCIVPIRGKIMNVRLATLANVIRPNGISYKHKLTGSIAFPGDCTLERGFTSFLLCISTLRSTTVVTVTLLRKVHFSTHYRYV